MEEIERMETVPMGSGSKEQLFEKGHPVIRELKRIPEIIFEEQIAMLPSSAIPVKSLFARKQMDHYHVDSLILKKIAMQVLHILRQLSECHIYPGIIDLQDLYVDMNNSQYFCIRKSFSFLHLSRIMNGIRKMKEYLVMPFYLMRRCSR